MSDTGDARLNTGYQTAFAIFANAPSLPKFDTPAEIADDWSRFSISTMMGDIWSRPGLDKPQRALVAIAGLVALNRPAQLRAYVHAALSLGVSRDTVCEVIFQMAGYAGFPAAIDGFTVAAAAFQEVDDAASNPKPDTPDTPAATDGADAGAQDD